MATLLFSFDVHAARQELRCLGAKHISVLTDEVLAAELPNDTDIRRLKASSPNPPECLSPLSQLWIESWAQDDETAKFAADTPRAWDAPGVEFPRNRHNDPVLAAEYAQKDQALVEAYPATNTYLIGPVAVGVFIVSGPKDDGLEITKAEQSYLLRQILSGLDGLGKAEPKADVAWIYDTNVITVTAEPGPGENGSTYEESEKGWRDEALKSLGYSDGGSAAQGKYVKELVKSKKTKWGFVIYLTKYPLRHFAYADRYTGYVALEYGHDNRGADNLQYTVAHEAAHVFGAADEYGKCKCTAKWGVDDIENGNCRNCSKLPQGKQLLCLMNSDNNYTVCDWSKKQLGWTEARFPFGEEKSSP